MRSTKTRVASAVDVCSDAACACEAAAAALRIRALSRLTGVAFPINNAAPLRVLLAIRQQSYCLRLWQDGLHYPCAAVVSDWLYPRPQGNAVTFTELQLLSEAFRARISPSSAISIGPLATTGRRPSGKLESSGCRPRLFPARISRASPTRHFTLHLHLHLHLHIRNVKRAAARGRRNRHHLRQALTRAVRRRTPVRSGCLW